MEAFINHSVGVQILYRDTCRPRRKLLNHRRKDVSTLETTFRGQSLRPISVFCPHRAFVSAPLRKLDIIELRASAARPEGEDDTGKDEPVVEKRARRWWNFRPPTEPVDEKHVENSVQNSVQQALDTDLELETSENESAGLPVTLVKSDTKSPFLSDEDPENEKEEHENSHEESKQGLLSILAGFMEDKRQKEATVQKPEPKQDDESWTEKFLDIIIPKRNAREAQSSEFAEPPSNASDTDAPDSREEEFREPLGVEGEAEKGITNLNSANPLDRLRGIRELYQPPPKALGDEKGRKNEGGIAKEHGKSNLVSKLIPWLGQSAAKDAIPEQTDIHTEESENATSVTEIEVFSERETPTEISASGSESLSNKAGDSVSSKHRSRSEREENRSIRSPTSVSAEESDTTGINSDGEVQKKKELAGTAMSGATAVEVSSVPQKDVAAIRLIFGSETFFATETVSHPGGLIFRGNLRGEPKATLAKLEQRLAARLGDKYTLCLAEGEEDLRPVVVVVPTARDRRPASPRQKLIALAIGFITLTTCFARGAYANLHSGVIRSAYGLPSNPTVVETLFRRAPVSCMAVSIALIVLFSQFVQRIVAARRKTRIALPYLIPSYQLGSFGAVVQLASPTPTRAALFDIAFSGALTLLLVSLALLVQGLRLSTSFPSVIPVSMSMVSSSMLIGALTTFVPQGQILVDYGKSWIGLHPLAVIGANCMTIAALNLLPIRQLDGGRIVSAIYGRKTAVLASRVTIFFLLLASAKVPYYFVFLAAVTFGPWSLDRPAKNELTEPNGVRAVLGYILLLAMVGILLPHPASKFFGTG